MNDSQIESSVQTPGPVGHQNICWSTVGAWDQESSFLGGAESGCLWKAKKTFLIVTFCAFNFDFLHLADFYTGTACESKVVMPVTNTGYVSNMGIVISTISRC